MCAWKIDTFEREYDPPAVGIPVCFPSVYAVWLEQLAEVQKSRVQNAGSGNQGMQENQKLKAALAQRQLRDADVKRRLGETVTAMQEALKTSEESTAMLAELVPGLDALQMQLLVELGR